MLTPIGSDRPDYYILGWNVNQEELDSQILFNPLAGDANRYLHSILSSLGFSNKVRFNKILNGDKVMYKGTESFLNFIRDKIEEDIAACNPKVIVALGSNAAEFLLGNRFVSLSTQSGRNLKCRVGDMTFPLVITYSPEYLIKDEVDDEIEGDANRQKFVSDFIYASKIANNEISDLSKKTMKFARTFEEFQQYYLSNLQGAERVAYDIETNAQPVHSASFRIIGFSLSATPDSGIYAIRESLDYTMPEDDWDAIVELTKQILSETPQIVHNCMYEVPATLNNWGMKLKNFDDTLVMSRLLLGGKTGAGLKEQCQINLGYPEWEEDLTTYRNAMDYLRNVMKPTPSGKSRYWYDELRQHGSSFVRVRPKFQQDCDTRIGEINDEHCFDDNDRKQALAEFYAKDKTYQTLMKINEIEAVLSEYYPDNVEQMLDEVAKEVLRLVDSNNYGFLPYSSVPYKLLALYGAVDAIGTRELYDYLTAKMKRDSTDEVDLFRGYEIMLAQFRVAVSMEMNGIYWDDTVAEDEYQWFNKKAIESMRNLLTSGFLDEKIFYNCREDWVKYLIEYNPQELKQLLGEGFYLTQKGIKKESGGREILFRNVPNLISDEYWNSVRTPMLSYLKGFKFFDDSAYTWYDSYKYIYNPASPKQETFLTECLVTEDIRVAQIIYEFTLMLEDQTSGWESFDENDRQPFELIKSINEYNAETEKYNISPEGMDNPRPKITKREKFERFKDLIGSTRFHNMSLNQKIIDCLNFKLSDAREGSMLYLYGLYEILGFDIESDRSEWSREFAFLIDYRSYKKCIKMMTTYITGNRVGRGMVAEISREDIDNNVELPVRSSNYSGNKPDTSEYILQPDFGVCATNTFRWRSGAHTIPGDASIKNIYRSRYKGGVIFAPDYSQAEIRGMAGLSGCQPMLDAFINGADIHKFNASKIFRCSEDEVTSAQRRYAKMFSFSILYGSTPEGAAADYLNNDIALARSIFDDFYSAFPEIKKFIEKMHDIMHRTGKVPVSKTGMLIDVSPNDFGGDDHKAERAAQNYPVQSCSSNMAGFVLSKANDYLLERDMKSKTILFIHDSLEFDVHPYEMIEFAAYLIRSMNEIPLKEFGVPMKIDLALGVSMGQEVEMSDLVVSDDMRSCECTIEGSLEDFDLLVDNWKDVYSVVEWEDLEEPEEIYIPKGNLFISKVAISRKLGRHQHVIKRRVKIAY